jgi:hypothetical protein
MVAGIQGIGEPPENGKDAGSSQGEQQPLAEELPSSLRLQERPTEESDVFRIHQPCTGSASPLQEDPLVQKLSSAAAPASNGNMAQRHDDTAAHLPEQPSSSAAGKPSAAAPASASTVPVSGGIAQGLAQAAGGSHAVQLTGQLTGQHAVAAGGGGFGVGTTDLEAADPNEFGGLQIRWAAEGKRWAVRASSAPSLVSASAPNARKVGGPRLRGARRSPVGTSRCVWDSFKETRFGGSSAAS